MTESPEQPIPVPGGDAPPEPRPTAALERRLAHDLARGRRLVLLTWLIAILHAALGLVAIRQAALLVDLDRDLVTTASIESFGASVAPLRFILAGSVVLAAWLTGRWLRGILPTMTALAERGAVDGPVSVSASPSTSRGGRLQRLGRLAVLVRPAGVRPELAGWADIRVGSGRRLVMATVATGAVAAMIGVLALAGLATAGDLESARAWRWLAGIDGGLWLVATILFGALVADIGWRAAVAGRAIGIFAPLSDAPGRVAIRLAPAILLFAGIAPALSTAPDGASISCPGAMLTCRAVVVPVDHRGGAAQGSVSIVYGVHRADGEPRGTIVVAVGGPGGSGLDAADSMLEAWDPELVRRYDIVFWDQRGVGKSDGHDCPLAGGLYSGVEPDAVSARAFVTACLNEAETGSSGLGRYATVQAAEDLESIREHLGVERFVLYGESYGTELSQYYAQAHPDRLAALILDGAVDLTLSANDFWATAARGFDDALTATFESCRADHLCRLDVRDPAGSYDRLLARLAADDVTVSYAGLDGFAAPHTITRASVESTVGSLLYEPAGRARFLRAVAASAAGDDIPIARLTELFGTGIGPVSTFGYYAIMCADYRVSPTADTTDIEAVLEHGRRTGALARRTDEVYLAQLPCLYWPDQPAGFERPAPIVDLAAPLIVIGATLDPITPIDLGRAIADRASNAYRIETIGGPHVTFGRGYACVDEAVLDFLLRDRLPPTRSVTCRDEVTTPYVPLAPEDAADLPDALAAMVALEDELFSDPFYAYLGGFADFTIGCRHGGTITVAGTEDRDEFTFDGCEFARGLAVDGTGAYTAASEELTFDVTFGGGFLNYESGDARSVTGSFRGERVDIEE